MSISGRLRASLIAFALVIAGGTLGYVLLGFTVLDAIYQTVTTITTVGFREVEPLNDAGKVFTMALILLGTGTALYTFSLLLETFIEGRLRELLGRRRMERQITAMRDHVIICGWGRVGRALAKSLAATKTDFVVVDTDGERLAGVAALTVEGDATDDAVLEAAGIDRARALVAATDTDAANLFITVSARAMRPDLFILARVRTEANEGKMARAGANKVVNPQSIGGARMAAFVSQPHVADFLDVVMHDGPLEFRLEEIPISATSPLAGTTLRDAEIRSRTGALVLALRDVTGRFNTNPPADTQLAGGQVLIAIGTPDELKVLASVAGVR